MQKALNLAGYTDAGGSVLEEDGKWGKKSKQAFDAMIADYAEGVLPESDNQETSEPTAAEVEPKIMFPFYGYTVCVFDSDDLPVAEE